MPKMSVVQVLLTSILAGTLSACAVPTLHERAINDAVVEREAASARLLKALAAYCAARFQTLEDRIGCLANRYQGFGAEESPFIITSGQRPAPWRAHSSFTQYARMFICEHHRSQATCVRAGRPLVEALTAPHSRMASRPHQ